MHTEKHAEIMSALRKKVLFGKHTKSGCPFPSERGLAQRLGVKRTVITRVIRDLNPRGFLVSRQGKGMFLTKAAQRSSGAVGLIVPGAGGSGSLCQPWGAFPAWYAKCHSCSVRKQPRRSKE